MKKDKDWQDAHPPKWVLKELKRLKEQIEETQDKFTST